MNECTRNIIPGRFSVKGITYGGNHGLEIQHADGTAYIHPLPGKDKENLAKAKKELQEQVKNSFVEIYVVAGNLKKKIQRRAMTDRGSKTRTCS